VAAAIAAGVVIYPAVAEAGVSVGADVQLLFPIDRAGSSIGAGFDGRLGYSIGLASLTLTPEVKGGFGSFGAAGGSVDMARLLGGGRLTIGSFLNPGAYVHVGYGRITSVGQDGVAFDVGALLDLQLSILTLGLHGGYAQIAVSSGDVKTVELGVHAAVTF
jgi:hypothetical protein